MKLDIIKREILDITVTDDQVQVALEVSISHGKVAKSITPITVEHVVQIEEQTEAGAVEDAIVMAVAGVNSRADEAIAALRGLTSL